MYFSPECARVLLFRGANHLSVNKQGQTALHVAHIVGTTAVADIITSHNPSTIVPYRSAPQYSTRRRLSTHSIRRSFSQTSLCSQDIYGTPKEQRKKAPSIAPSPSPSRISRLDVASSDYGTMRRFTPEMAPGHEANIPRILVIPRDMNSPLDFEPTSLSPALQFFEGVDMSGMAMRAGLRPGDFLLEIDGVDVRSASHEQVVHLIQQAGNTITLKVITVDPSVLMNGSTVSVRPRSAYSETRCASVKQRYGGGRRISAAELENLMIRQGEHRNYHEEAHEKDSVGFHTPKKYNSVSDMKRRKQRTVTSPHGLQRSYDYQSETDYSQPFRHVFRPKTPPPPPPSSQFSTQQCTRLISPYETSFIPKSTEEQNSTAMVVPASHDFSSCPSSLSHPPLVLANSDGTTKIGVSVEALRSVALKKREEDERKVKPAAGITAPGPPDFHADLKNALAKRRTKVTLNEEDDDKKDVESLFGGLSLRESVRENVQTKDFKQHSPSGIANKKDSGYTSSRTSLEPSEFGEDRADRLHCSVDCSTTNRHNVTLISQSIEDNYGAQKNIDNMSVSSTLSTLSGCSGESRSITIPVVPPVDYDDPDSGAGGSDCDVQISESGAFESKVLLNWTCVDAVQWLLSLGLDEYVEAFQARRVDGRSLSKCDRSTFTQLGITRIAHRQKMEASLRQYVGNA
ncbi:hypothetical protein DICVIV_01200 [Dictyocaulus viviparus]|uniref:SAM domain-containing protein n=1 Tax=Dictyocaulus viviparus TaxID=29172 RepID=A0A0D8Y7A2_DICVI|nr:hypothetical protein DICVIV_01200 [Dictyocaulus viviparus]